MRNIFETQDNRGRGRGGDDGAGDDHGGGRGGGRGRGGGDDKGGDDAGDDNGGTRGGGRGRGHDDPAGDDNGGDRGGRGRGGDDPAGDDRGGRHGGHGADDMPAQRPMAAGALDATTGGPLTPKGPGREVSETHARIQPLHDKGPGGGDEDDADDVRLQGDDNANTLDGGAGDDRLAGNGGNDVVNGLAGDDRLAGGDGDDVISAGAGSDRVEGGAGNDVITSDNAANEDNADVRIGDGMGDDTVTVIGSPDTRVDIRSGAGNDQISIDGAERVKVKDAAGADTITLSGEMDRAKIQLDSVEGADINEVDTVVLGADADFGRALRLDNFVAGDGGDVFDFSAWMDANTSWDGVADPFADGFVQLVQAGDDVLLMIDADGGADGFETLVTFGDVLAADFTEANLDLVV